MSFTIQRLMINQDSASSLGVQLDSSAESVEVTYTAKSVVFVSNAVATIEFEVVVSGYDAIGIRHIDCPYTEEYAADLTKFEAYLQSELEKHEEALQTALAKEATISAQMALAQEMADIIEADYTDE